MIHKRYKSWNVTSLDEIRDTSLVALASFTTTVRDAPSSFHVNTLTISFEPAAAAAAAAVAMEEAEAAEEEEGVAGAKQPLLLLLLLLLVATAGGASKNWKDGKVAVTLTALTVSPTDAAANVLNTQKRREIRV